MMKMMMMTMTMQNRQRMCLISTHVVCVRLKNYNKARNCASVEPSNTVLHSIVESIHLDVSFERPHGLS
jgi:hypothetical protein